MADGYDAEFRLNVTTFCVTGGFKTDGEIKFEGIISREGSSTTWPRLSYPGRFLLALLGWFTVPESVFKVFSKAFSRFFLCIMLTDLFAKTMHYNPKN